MPAVQQETYVMMRTSKMIVVACIFIVIRLNSYLPSIITYGLGAVAIAIIFMIRLMFPSVTKMYEVTAGSIAEWNTLVASTNNNKDRKYLIRKYRALRPLRFYCGFLDYRFYMFEQSVTMEYVMDIVHQLIDTMIAYPEKVIEAAFNNAYNL
jgi:hypothetical protein